MSHVPRCGQLTVQQLRCRLTAGAISAFRGDCLELAVEGVDIDVAEVSAALQQDMMEHTMELRKLKVCANLHTA